ncbi:MAG: MarR family transcriptional regulator [Clostridia bacterium]|nr:MarR family transcriptional regulator [Clostridia bacterium]
MEEEKKITQEQLYFRFYLCGKEITCKYTELLKEVDLTYTQFVVMRYFWLVGSSNLKDMTKVLMLDPSTLSPILKKLEAKGFIERHRSETDERNLIITLTPKGVEVEEKALKVKEKMAEFVQLTQEEAQTLNALTEKLLVHILEQKEKEKE